MYAIFSESRGLKNFKCGILLETHFKHPMLYLKDKAGCLRILDMTFCANIFHQKLSTAMTQT